MTAQNPLIAHFGSIPKPRTDLDRILDLPVRPIPEDPPDLTEWCKAPHGNMDLWPVQSWALGELARTGGLLAPIGVGCGKTLITLLSPLAYSWYTTRPCERPLLVVPSKLVEKTIKEQKDYGEHFRLHPNLKILSYWKLSREEYRFFLQEYRPDLIICDEGHKLKRLTSTRTKRFQEYLGGCPDVGFVVLSGTITSNSVLDYAHLSGWALRQHSPLPIEYTWLKSLSACVDVDGVPQSNDIWRWEPLVKHFSRIEAPSQPETETGWSRLAESINDIQLERRRDALQHRMMTAPGVITTPKAEVDCSLILEARQGPKDHAIESALHHLLHYWELPGAEAMFCDGARVSEAAKQISQGFYYVWDWPNNNPDYDWLDTRSQWAKACRAALHKSVPGLDSELLIRKACIRGEAPSHECKEAWRHWSLLRDVPPPPKRVVWLSTSLIDDAIGWLKENDPAILWYRHSTALQPMLESRGIPCFGSGAEPPLEAISCGMSIGTQGEGKNLQDRWSRGLVLCPPSSGSVWEQLLGRKHRHGQTDDEVWYAYYNHLEPFQDAMSKAFTSASYLEKLQRQRLLYCTKI